MRKIIFIVSLLALFTGGKTMAVSPTEAIWNAGNKLFQMKVYDSAAACYEILAAQKSSNPVIYYNLGNAYYKMNKIGSSILNYQKALHLNPEYNEAKDNLALAQARITIHIPHVEEIFFIKWWNDVTKAANANMWAVVSLVLFLVIVLLSAIRYLHLIPFKIPVQIPLILGFVWVSFIVFAYSSAQNITTSGLAVIMVNDTPLMNADLKPGKTQSLLPEGVTVKVLSTKGSYVEIQVPDGRKGWIDVASIAKI